MPAHGAADACIMAIATGCPIPVVAMITADATARSVPNRARSMGGMMSLNGGERQDVARSHAVRDTAVTRAAPRVLRFPPVP